MTITRETIVSTLQDALSQRPDVLAVWLEGADATGSVDEYSDIDLCCSMSDPGALNSAVDCAQAALENLGSLDLNARSEPNQDMQTGNFHLAGTSPYLVIDFDVFYRRGSDFTAGDPIERPLVLFDHAGVVTFRPVDEPAIAARRAARLRELEAGVSQHARIEKYVLRGQFLEAFGYYHRWLLMPLIEALRMRYTPLHPDYYIVHISRHLPAEVLRRLEDLFQVGSLEEIRVKMHAALALFDETAAFLREQA